MPFSLNVPFGELMQTDKDGVGKCVVKLWVFDFDAGLHRHEPCLYLLLRHDLSLSFLCFSDMEEPLRAQDHLPKGWCGFVRS